MAKGEREEFIVLDIGPPEGYFSLKELQQTYTPLPDTRRTSTAHKGLHYYFAYPDDVQAYFNTVGLAGLEGVDIPANDGYVVLPPSRLYNILSYTMANEEKPIAPLPSWFTSFILHVTNKPT